MDIAGVFDSAVARDPDALAFVDGDRRRTYRGWDGDIGRAAGGLARLGLKRGDRLMCVMPNSYEMATLYWASQRLARSLPRSTGAPRRRKSPTPWATPSLHCSPGTSGWWSGPTSTAPG